MRTVVDVRSIPRDGAENWVESTNIASNQVQTTSFEQVNDDQDMVMKARKWIGVLVDKEFQGKRYMGTVVDFNGETKFYKIDYDNNVSEEVGYQELQQIIATPQMVYEYLERINPSAKEKKKRHLSDTMVPIHPRRYSAVQQAAEPKRKKGKKSNGTSSTSTYVPLAFRGKKRDEYYYY